MPAQIEGGEPGLASDNFSEIRTARIKQIRPYSAGEVVRAFGPVVYGVATALLPENPPAAEKVVAAVFELFELRRSRLKKKLFVAAWLLQTTIIAARRKRKRLRLPLKPSTAAQTLVYYLPRLSRKLREALVLGVLAQVERPRVATALNIRETRLAKRIAAGTKKLQRRIRKSGAEAGVLLGSMAISLPLELAQSLMTPAPERTASPPLVRETLWGWRWLKLRVALKRTLATVGGAVCVVALLFGVFVYLATHGYLMGFFMRMGQREMAKEFPEMLAPAGPWPVSDADRGHARFTPPATTDELFTISNIWPVTLTFTPAQLKALEPSRVPPVRGMFQNGRIILRNPEAKRSGLSGVLGFEFNWSQADLNFAGHAYGPIGVRIRGNGTYLNSMHGPKQSLKLDLNRVEKKKDIAGVQELNFLNAIVDYSYLHDALGQAVFRELGAIGPRTAFGYITVEVLGSNGSKKTEPRGLFVMVENIDNEFAENRFGTKKAPIFKPVTYDLFLDFGDKWEAYEEIYDLKTKATPEELQRVVEFAKLVSHASDEEFARKLPDYLDLEEFAAFLGGHVLLSSYDGFLVNGQNYYVYLDPRSNKFGFVPWDQDHGWGDFGHIATTEKRENASIWHPAVYDFTFLNRVLKVEAFREVYRQTLERALKTCFTKEALYPQIDAIAAIIRPAVAAESSFRLKRFDTAVSSEWTPGPRDGPAEGPKAPVHQIKRFIENRIQSVRDQLDGKSEGVRIPGFR